MMKLPFHTTAKSTARLLMSIPSYWYCRRGQRHMLVRLSHGAGMLGVSGDRDYSRKEARDSGSLG